jgi:uncharacterized protein YbaR (Trm112 family)
MQKGRVGLFRGRGLALYAACRDRGRWAANGVVQLLRPGWRPGDLPTRILQSGHASTRGYRLKSSSLCSYLQLGDDSLPEKGPEVEDELPEELLRRLHHVLLEIHVVEGAMTCPNCGHVYQIRNGIPNMVSGSEDEHARK